MNRTSELNLRAFIAASDASWEAKTAARNDLDFLLDELTDEDPVRMIRAGDDRGAAVTVTEPVTEPPVRADGRWWEDEWRERHERLRYQADLAYKRVRENL